MYYISLLLSFLIYVFAPQLKCTENNVDLGFITCNTYEHELPYQISAAFRMVPSNAAFYRLIDKELISLNNVGAVLFIHESNFKIIAPHIYTILESKIKRLASAFNMSFEDIRLGVKAMDDNSDLVFNAHAQQFKTKIVVEQKTVRVHDGAIVSKSSQEHTYIGANIILNNETLRMILWYQGSFSYASEEGLLDGILAHEMAHIFHKHTQSSQDVELEADATASKYLQSPHNLFCGIEMLSLAHYLYILLCKQPVAMFSIEEKLFFVNSIVSSLIQKNNGLGILEAYSTHMQFGNVINKAYTLAMERVLQKGMRGNIGVIGSLIFDELDFECQQKIEDYNEKIHIFEMTEEALSLHSLISHPPLAVRKKNIFYSFYN